MVLWGDRGRGGAILTQNELVFPFGGSYVCDNFGENQSRNATVKLPTDTLTDANRFYKLSRAVYIAMGQKITSQQYAC